MLAQREGVGAALQRHAGEVEKVAVVVGVGHRVHDLVVVRLQPHAALGVAPDPLREFLAHERDALVGLRGFLLVHESDTVRVLVLDGDRPVVQRCGDELVEADHAPGHAPLRAGLGAGVQRVVGKAHPPRAVDEADGDVVGAGLAPHPEQFAHELAVLLVGDPGRAQLGLDLKVRLRFGHHLVQRIEVALQALLARSDRVAHFMCFAPHVARQVHVSDLEIARRRPIDRVGFLQLRDYLRLGLVGRDCDLGQVQRQALVAGRDEGVAHARVVQLAGCAHGRARQDRGGLALVFERGQRRVERVTDPLEDAQAF